MPALWREGGRMNTHLDALKARAAEITGEPDASPEELADLMQGKPWAFDSEDTGGGVVNIYCPIPATGALFVVLPDEVACLYENRAAYDDHAEPIYTAHPHYDAGLDVYRFA